MSKATGSELAIPVRSSTDLASLQELAEIMRSDERIEVVDDPEQISREIFEQILAGESDEALNQLGEATGWRELEGQQVMLGDGFRWRPSSYKEGAPVFLVIPGSLIGPDGVLTPIVLTTGSRNVIAQLMNLAARDHFKGRIVRLEKAKKPSSRGYYALWLKIENPVSPDDEEVPAEAVES